MNNIRYIPSFFRSRPLWVLWKKEKDKNGRETKVPYSVRGYKASTTDSHTWSTFNKACETLVTGNYNGLGVVMSKELGCVFIDIDHCIDPDAGELSEDAEEIH